MKIILLLPKKRLNTKLFHSVIWTKKILLGKKIMFLQMEINVGANNVYTKINLRLRKQITRETDSHLSLRASVDVRSGTVLTEITSLLNSLQ